MTSRWGRLFAPLVLVLATLVVGSSWGSDTELENPKQVLKEASKTLSKQKGYAVDFTRTGGFLKGEGPYYENVGSTIDYDAKVYKNILEFDKPKAFKTPKGGAIRDAGTWRRILATKEGATMGRIVDFPSLLLANAVRHGSEFEWIGAASEESTASGEGRTGVMQTKYNKIRVTLPAKIAVDYANTLDSAG